MVLFKSERVQRLWDTWNIRGLIILSLLVHSFLVLLAPLRKARGGKWVAMIWLAYLLAGWVTTFTIGLMLRAEHSKDILALWAPFLLLHLGGPDLITSFSLEDNEFWIRHLIRLSIQVGLTTYAILQSLPENKLLLPAFLVLIAGTIKYGERNRSFYLASMDNFGDNWRKHWSSNVTHGHFLDPIRMLMSVERSDEKLDGFPILKSQLIGPRVTSNQKHSTRSTIRDLDSKEVLKSIEKSLSLFYDLFHTKLRITTSSIGILCRYVYFGCILGALVSFSTLKKQYKLGEFDAWLTYVLLIGALALDLISFISLIVFCDIRCPPFVNVPRWSSSVTQLNFITYHFKDYPVWFNMLVDYLGIKSLLDVIRRIRCECSEDFSADQEWKFIFTELWESNPIAHNEQGRGAGIHANEQGNGVGIHANERESGTAIHANERGRRAGIHANEQGSGTGIHSNEQRSGTGIHAKRYGGILKGRSDLNWSIKHFEYMESLVMWHIATEICYRTTEICYRTSSPSNCPSSPSTCPSIDLCKICYRRGGPSNCPSPTPTSISIDDRKICKLLSDYMFYLLVAEPSMIPTPSPDQLKDVFRGEYHGSNIRTWKWPNEKGFKEPLVLELDKLLDEEKKDVEKLEKKKTEGRIAEDGEEKDRENFSRVTAACYLAKELLSQFNGCPWELMSRVWVEFVCYAAINCKPVLHARQVSSGGQLLTLVWLLMNLLGLTRSKEWHKVEGIEFDLE